jgi:DNA invertase Pin-like site-specific DNA recombinase
VVGARWTVAAGAADAPPGDRPACVCWYGADLADVLAGVALVLLVFDMVFILLGLVVVGWGDLSKSRLFASFHLTLIYRRVLTFIFDTFKKGREMAKIGYARVSSKTQDYQAQIEALKAAGCEKIFSEKASGKSTKDRRQFDRLMKALLPGDTVYVAKLDRLARSSRDLHNILHDLDKAACGFVSLGEAWCDTTTSIGRLMVSIMSGIAQFERELIRARCEDGIARAKAKGITFGRKRKLNPEMIRVAAGRYAKGETMAQLAAVYGVSEPTMWRALQ